MSVSSKGTRSGTVIALDMTRRIVLIGGTGYAGEIKKSVFSLFNFHAPLAGVLPIILLSSVLGALIGSVWLAMKGRDRATPIPFGPYLAIAGWIVFMWGEELVGAYMSYAGLA